MDSNLLDLDEAKMRIAELRQEGIDLSKAVADLHVRLREAADLLRAVPIGAGEKYIEQVRTYLNSAQPTEPDTCCGDLMLSQDRTYWTCNRCGKDFPMAVTPALDAAWKELP